MAKHACMMLKQCCSNVRKTILLRRSSNLIKLMMQKPLGSHVEEVFRDSVECHKNNAVTTPQISHHIHVTATTSPNPCASSIAKSLFQLRHDMAFLHRFRRELIVFLEHPRTIHFHTWETYTWTSQQYGPCCLAML